MTQINKICFNYLNKYSNLTNQELKKQCTIMLVSLLTSISSMFLTVLYLFLNCGALVIVNFMGASIVFICHALLNKKQYNKAGILLTFFLVFLIISDDIFVGNSNYSILYLFLVLIINMIIPYSKHIISIVIGVFLPFFMIGLFIYGNQNIPRYQLGDTIMYYGIFNIFISSFGIIVLQGLSRYIDYYVDFYSQQKICTLQAQAYTDALTEMYNRHYANMILNQIQCKNVDHPISIAMIDIDDFKKINDTYGHDAGDLALKDVANKIKSNIRQSDFVFRWGGEEFLVLLNDINLEKSFEVLDKIRKCVESHIIYYADKTFSVTVTIGVSWLDNRDICGSIDVCDQKLYEGKRTGKNKIVK